MKPISFFLVGTMLLLASCSEEIDNTTTGTTAEPGTYIVGINLNMEVPLTKGINYEENGVFSFDSNYSCDSIYLHNGANSILIPVSEIAECGEGCKGFTYKICTDNGQTTITPIKADGSESDEKLQIDSNYLTYFSSSSEDIWQACPISESVPHDASATLYKRTEENNVELFRSTDNLTVKNLQDGGQLNMERVCSGFTFFCTFTDRTDNELTKEDFKSIMKDSPDKFLIKIYIGGSGFTDQYDIKNRESSNTDSEGDGYYASGNSFIENDYGNTDYVSLRDSISSGAHGLGYGYATLPGNELITPIRNLGMIKAYIYISYGTKTIYTTVQNIVTPEEGNFYRIGADIDINELKAALFDDYENLPTPASADTRSTSAPRLFTPKSLITHIEY